MQNLCLFLCEISGSQTANNYNFIIACFLALCPMYRIKLCTNLSVLVSFVNKKTSVSIISSDEFFYFHDPRLFIILYYEPAF